ncbi:hypothetical protein LOAG_18384 [Loa loa]|uniref:Homeobox domain-containing protein n=1 Tax=Loa loa TaxID=7209 RepID=A0A1I7VA63_LOALO|nr:hypothetical protein LOAG_18384 [Loa loa]EJD74281.1 hypothetical protein LOAG_18384 [Loa loa]
MVASYVFPHGATSPTTEATLILSSSPSSVAAIEKTKQRQQAAMLDAWLAMHGDNLYPCREEKERLAKDMSMTYIQVNRWFANRRRKQTKRRKTEVESPRSLTIPSLSSSVAAINRHNSLTGLLESEQNPNWLSKSPLDSVQIEQKKKPEMVVQTAHSDLRKTDIETLKDELRRNTPSAHISNTSFQQVPDVNRSLTSPCSLPDQRRIPHSTTVDNKLLPTPPAYTPSPLNAMAAAAATGNLPAAIAAAAAAQTANPFLLAAALGLQQQQQPQNASPTFPWISNAQSFTAMLPYIQHLQAQVQQQAQAQVALAQQIAAQQAANLHQQFKTIAAAAAAAHTSLISQQQQQQQQPQPQSHWLSPPPSVPPQISAIRQTTTCLSPLLPAAAESTSSLLEFTELNPRPHPEPQPPSPPASSSSSLYNDEKQQQQQQFLFDEDLMIDSLMEERKDLSEKESIAVAVLAGMAACQR